MKPSASLGLQVLALLWAALPAFASAGADPKAKTSIPKIARFGEVQIGYSTQEDLAKRWGEGKIITGGHPNSGRLWRVKGTPWVLRTDGFDYSERGLVVDAVEIEASPGASADIPYAKLPARSFAWLGRIKLGMPQAKAMKFLRSRAMPSTPTKEGCKLAAQGSYALETNVRLRTWTARLDFTDGILRRLALEAVE